MTEKYAIVKNGLVINMMLWAGPQPREPGAEPATDGWQPPEGHEAVLATDSAAIGWTYAGGVFADPNPTAAAAQPTNAQLKQAAIDKVRAERKGIMGMLDGMQASALAKADLPRGVVIETAKQALRDLTKIDTSTCVTALDFKTLFVSRYKLIAGALPADVRLAFAEALL